MKKTSPKYNNLLNPSSINQKLIEDLLQAYHKAGGLKAAMRVATKAPGWSPVTAVYISDNGDYADLAKGEIHKRLRDIDAILAAVSGKSPSETLYHDIPAQDWR